MRRIALFASTAAAALAFAVATSSAADLESPIDEGYDWTGFYIGAGGGYRWADFEVDSEVCVGAACVEDSFELEDDGFFGTVEAGFDYQLVPSFLIGVLASYDFGQKLEDDDFNNVGVDAVAAPGADEGQFFEASIDDIFTVAARAGFVWDRALLYVLGGWSWANAEASLSQGCDLEGDGGPGPCGDFTESDDDIIDGLTLGGGVEFLFTENISLRVEYRHIDFDDIELSGVLVPATNTGSSSTDTDVDSIRGTINFRF
ncbi:MAG: outer membrane beta-barrel protein [Pseudomonadota bacterium]|nr:outer membrane beta-barrel protein [Pseudomonadota bacterium]